MACTENLQLLTVKIGVNMHFFGQLGESLHPSLFSKYFQLVREDFSMFRSGNKVMQIILTDRYGCWSSPSLRVRGP